MYHLTTSCRPEVKPLDKRSKGMQLKKAPTDASTCNNPSLHKASLYSISISFPYIHIYQKSVPQSFSSDSDVHDMIY